MSLRKGLLEKVPRYDPMVACRTLDGEAVIIHSRTRRLHVLDEVGTFIWEAVASGDRTVAQIIGSLCIEYEVDEATAEEDVGGFLGELARENLLHLEDALPR